MTDVAEARTLVEDAGLLANLADLDLVWRHRLDPDRPPPPTETAVLSRTPWPAPKITDGWWPTHRRADYLRWLATAEAPQPWVRTMAALHAQKARMEDAPRDAHSSERR